jgi:asparagine synthase (glutamine-hydrolysing)
MAGIVGLVTKMPRAQAHEQVRRMLQTTIHDQSHSAGLWADESAGVYVGWTALAGSFSEAMPLHSARNDTTLLFSGEDFRAPDSGLMSGADKTRASYLLRLFEQDETFPANLNGWFHGMVVDRVRGTATLFNDRFGMHRLYCHESADGFYFAVEAKAILAVRGELRTIDSRSLGEFISCGCVLENRTLFQGVRVMPPGTTYRFRNGTLETAAKYFESREWENQSVLGPEAYYAEIRDVFARVLPWYFGGEQKVGMSLTGGLDTRMIMAWDKSAPGTLPCYTWGGARRDCQDVIVARRVAQLCQQPHQVVTVGEEFLKRFDYYAERAVFLTDGGVDVSMAPDVYMNQRASQIAPVRMTGLYGGEVLRRVRAFKPVKPSPGVFAAALQPFIERAVNTYNGILDTHPLSFAVFRQAPWHHYGTLSLEQTQVTMRTPFLDNEFVKTVFRAPGSACLNSDISLRLIAEGNPVLRPLRTDRGIGGGGGRLGATLTRAYFEFLFKAEYAYDYGMPQWLTRVDRFASPLHLERLFLGRHKGQHFRVWYKGALASYVRQILLDPVSLARSYLEANALERVVHAHLKGDANYTTEIHKLIGLELLHRRLIDAPLGVGSIEDLATVL